MRFHELKLIERLHAERPHIRYTHARHPGVHTHARTPALKMRHITNIEAQTNIEAKLV